MVFPMQLGGLSFEQIAIIVGFIASIITIISCFIVKPWLFLFKRWEKYSSQSLPMDRFFPREYGYKPDVYIPVNVDEKLSEWRDKPRSRPLLVRGITGVGKSRAVVQFLEKTKCTVMLPDYEDIRDKKPPILSSLRSKGYVLYLDDLHNYQGKGIDSKMLKILRGSPFRIIATIPDEEYDSNWEVLGSFIWQEVTVEPWSEDMGKRLASKLGKKFIVDEFKENQTPLSVISPLAEMERIYERSDKAEKDVLNTLKMIKEYLNCYVTYSLVETLAKSGWQVSIQAFANVQGRWCKTKDNKVMLRDDHEKAIRYNPSIKDADYIQKILSQKDINIEKKEIAEYLFYLGNKFYNLEKPGKAIECYDKALENNPKLAEVWYNKGNTLRDKGELDEALKCYDKALENNPKYANAWNNKGVMLKDKGELDEALKCYNRATKINPKLAEAWNNKGNMLSEKGEQDKAIECYDKALENNPKDAKAWYNKGNMLSEKGEQDKAIECYDKALENNPKLAEAWNNKGIALGKKGEQDKALKCYDKATKINPKYAEAWYNKGNMLSEKGEQDKALKCYDKATKINPKYAEAWNNKGNVFIKKGELDKAIECYDKVLEINPKDVVAWYNKGIALGKKGELDKALKCFEAAKKFQ